MKVSHDENRTIKEVPCAQAQALVCALVTAVFITLAALFASGAIGRVHGYEAAAGCSLSALVTALCGVILWNKEEKDGVV